MKFNISTIQTQKPILSPSMQQSIEVLLLPLAELTVAIDQELQNNPLLEVDEAKTISEQSKIEELVSLNINRMTNSKTIDQEDSGEYYSTSDEDLDDLRPVSRAPSLEDTLLEQLRIEIVDPVEFKIGELIIGNLNEDGYLNVSLAELAASLPEIEVSLIEKVLEKIQHFEPMGIASRNLKECLINQLRSMSLNGHSELILKLVTHHLELLGRRKFSDIAKALKITEEKVRELAQIISTLEPKPARKYHVVEGNLYVKPDMTIFTDNEGNYQVVVSHDNVPHLRISPLYQKMLKAKNCSVEEMEFIKEKIKNALLFIKSIEQRKDTLKEIARYILAQQKDFFEHGSGHLKPMVLQDVAKAIDRNESTISRATHNKFIDTPQGVLPLKYFFTQALSNNENGDDVSNQSIKDDLEVIIQQEDKSKPLSDHEIEVLLKNRGLKVARRTISKYRRILRILPSHLRKQ